MIKGRPVDKINQGYFWKKFLLPIPYLPLEVRGATADHCTNLTPNNLFTDIKRMEYNLSMVTEEYNYLTRSATNKELSVEHYRTDLRKFCPTVIGKYFCNYIPLSIRS